MIEQRVAIVTGGANGIGRAITQRMARAGYLVEAWDIDRRGLSKLDDSVRGRRIDLEHLDEVESAVGLVAEAYGRLDLLVHSAVWRELIPLDELTLESWERTMRIGLTVPAFLTRWSAPLMRDSGGGVVVNISSIMSRRAGGIAPAYVAAKGGLDALTYELAVRYAAWGIRVVGIRPGAVDTALSRDYGADPDRAVDAMRRWSCDQIPLGRWADPDEISAVVAMVAGHKASYLTGTTIDVDGGWSTSHFPASLRRDLPQRERNDHKK